MRQVQLTAHKPSAPDQESKTSREDNRNKNTGSRTSKANLINFCRAGAVLGILSAVVLSANAWGINDAHLLTVSQPADALMHSAENAGAEKLKTLAELPTYAQRYANSTDNLYSLSGVNLQNYSSSSDDRIASETKELINAVYFDNAYLAQYINTAKTGVLNVFCEVTEADDVYVYDLYSYKGPEEAYKAETPAETAVIQAVIDEYAGAADADIQGDNSTAFSNITVTDLRWGKTALTDENCSHVLVGFRAVLGTGEQCSNYALVQLDSRGQVKSAELL